MTIETTIEEAIAQIPDGARIMVGGFGCPGTPFSLINELVRQGTKHLTLIKNDANEVGIGISKLIENNQVERVITTHLGLNKAAIERMNNGSLQVEFFPQGIWAEKIRIAGAGAFGFLSDIGLDSEITSDDQIIEWKGKKLKIEEALEADFAILHAAKADHFGNLVYQGSAMNASPLMAMAADKTIVEAIEICKAGDLDPLAVHTPGAFVDCLVGLPELSADYGVLEHHVQH